MNHRTTLSLSLSLLLSLLLTACTPTSPAGFSPDQQVMIANGDAQTPMRVFKITSQSDSILLRTASEDVKVIPGDPELKLFTDRLYATVRDSLSLGIGIAAPQVGILKNIIWCQRLDKKEEGFPFEVYLNPRIVEYSEEKQRNREGCLSIPNKSAYCDRSEWIVLEYDKLDGTHHRETISGFTAVVFQHEVDHLNGILYLDHLAEHQGA